MSALSETGAYARDAVYLDRPRGEPKHMFAVIAEAAERALGRPPVSVLDVGSASGDFAAYALERFPGASVQGLEYSRPLVARARESVPNASFIVGDANSMSGIADQAFEAVFMTGTHSIFDDFRPSFGECIRTAAPGGIVIVTGLFNSYPVDARIHWRLAEQSEAPWHPGYNLFSERSVGAYLESHPRVAFFGFEPFTLPFDLPPQPDPIRSWTEAKGESRTLRNGIMPLPMQTLAVRLRP